MTTVILIQIQNYISSLYVAVLINEDPVSWAVAGDQVIITLQGMDIAKIK